MSGSVRIIGISVQDAAGSWIAYRGCSVLMDMRYGLSVVGLDDGVHVRHYQHGDWLTIQPLLDMRTERPAAAEVPA